MRTLYDHNQVYAHVKYILAYKPLKDVLHIIYVIQR